MVGLGIDCTSTGVEVQHPTDVTAPDLPPQPVLLVRRAASAAAGKSMCRVGWWQAVRLLVRAAVSWLLGGCMKATALCFPPAGGHVRWRAALLHLWPHGLVCRRPCSLCRRTPTAAAAASSCGSCAC